MDMKKLAAGTVTGVIVLFIQGGIFYAGLLANFFAEQAEIAGGGSAMLAEPNMMYIFVGELALAFLVTYIYTKWANISTFATGAKAGALIGALVAVAVGMVMVGTTTTGTMTGALVSIVVEAFRVAVAGGVIGLVLGKMS